jgi:hypothetical protein
MRINIVLTVVLIIIFGGCGLIFKSPESEVGKIKTTDGKLWTLTTYVYLQNSPDNYHIRYVGTYNEHHLIYNQSKIYLGWYALKRNEFTPTIEFIYSGFHNNMPLEFLFERKNKVN